MYKFRVVPKHKNGYSAPYMVVEVPNTSKNPYDDAINISTKDHRLSNIESWHFVAVMI